jgi:hypothetical protein
MSFDKVGKLIKEDYELSSHDHENNDLLKVIGGISKLNEANRAMFCRWVKYGFIEGSKAFVSPVGTITLTDWSSEVDPLIHDLINNGIATLNDRGYVEIPYMMRWSEITDLSPVCADDSLGIDPSETIYPSPMIMKVPPSKELIEDSYDDLSRSLANTIKGFDFYIDGEVVHVGLNVRSIGFVNPVLFRSPIDVLVVTDNRSIVAHKVIDPSRTVHRGLSSMEHYLLDGIDYAVLVHKYTYYEDHVETFNKIISRQYIRDSGFVIVPYELDYMIFLKWPRYNSIVTKSQGVAGKRALIGGAISFMLNAR